MTHLVVLVCPCCATPAEAQTDPCPQAITCDNCEQQWTMIVDAPRVSTHSLLPTVTRKVR